MWIPFSSIRKEKHPSPTGMGWKKSHSYTATQHMDDSKPVPFPFFSLQWVKSPSTL